MQSALRKLFDYHAWANEDLFDALERLDPERHGVELQTALRLINHVHVVSRIFAAHLEGTAHGYSSDNTEETPTLDTLRTALSESDRWYCDYLRRSPAAGLSEKIPFTFTDGDKGFMSREEMLTHVALHAGYHRGEVGRLLWQLGITPPWDTFAVYLHQNEPSRRLQGAPSAAMA
jgi:uncharacterized damage-inducible protein DinB